MILLLGRPLVKLPVVQMGRMPNFVVLRLMLLKFRQVVLAHMNH